MRNHPPEPGADPEPTILGPSGSKPPKRRLWLTLTVGVVGLLAAGWTVAWQVTAMMTEAALDRWMDDRRAMGERLLHTGKPMLDGFPLTVRFRIQDPVWESVQGPQRVTLATSVITVANTPLAPTRLRIETAEDITATVDTPDGILEITGEQLLAELDIGATTVTAGEGLLTGLIATGPAGETVGTLDRLSLSMAPPAESESSQLTPISRKARAAAVPVSVMLDIGITRLTLSDRFEVPFEGAADLDARVAVEGPVPQLDPTSLTLWRDQGGVVDIRSVSLRWGTMALVGDGTFGLDPMLRPEGAATVSASGLPGVIDRVVDMGRMKRQHAAFLKLALIAGAKTPEDGGPPRVTLPLTIQRGVVSLGPAPIGRVGSLVR
jgi:hypothetical protein